MQHFIPARTGQTHLNPKRERERSTTAHISFQPTETCARAPVSPSRTRVIKNHSSIKYPMNALNYNFIRLGLTGAKALQTARRFS